MAIFDINEFKAKAGLGLLRNNKFLVKFEQMPRGMNGRPEFVKVFADLSLYVESVDIPGINLDTHNDYKRYGYGPLEKKPYMASFPDARIMVRSDQDGRVFEFFREWQMLAVNFAVRDQGRQRPQAGPGTAINTPTGFTDKSTSIGGTAVKTLSAYEINYKRNYAIPVTVQMYREDGRESQSIVLRDAFPSLIVDMPLAWAMNKTYAQMPIALVFSDMMYFGPID